MLKPNFMEKLLDGVEVEWTTIEEIIIDKFWIMPATPKFNEDAEIPYITSKNIKGGHISFEKVKFISRLDYIELSRNRPILAGDILISMIGTIGEIAIVKDTDLDFYGQNMYLIRLNNKLINSNFFLHFFDSPTMKSHFNSVKNNSGQGYLKAKDIENLLIPIPPLHIQEEIVRTLDTFTELIKELIKELTARKKQYEYYRDKLLSFENGQVDWKVLGEIGELVRGNGLLKTDFTENGVPAIHYGQIYTHYGTFTTETKSFVSYETAKKLKKVDTGDVVITNTSENLEDVGKAVAYLGQVQAVTGGHATVFKPSNKISGKYFAYFTQTEMFAIQKRKYAKGTKVIDVSATDMSKIIIPIPSLAEQERIVSILDKFDALTNSITEGLPGEIELRQKQYEYYRNMLLSFPKQEV